MPCSLGLSVANARVEDEAIARLLTPDVAKKIVEAYFAQRGQSVRTWRDGETLYAEAGVPFLTITRGRVGASGVTRARAQDVVDELTAALTAAGEALFAAQVQRALTGVARGGRMAARQVEVEEAGQRARAYVLSFEVR